MLLGAGGYVGPRLLSPADPATAVNLAAPSSSVYGVVAGGDAPRRLRWSTTAADVLAASGVVAPNVVSPSLQVISPAGAGGGSGAVPGPASRAGSGGAEGPVLVLARASVGAGSHAAATARVAGIDPDTGAVRWRGPALGDVPDCAATDRLLACAERTADAGRVVLLDPTDGREIARTPVPGRAARVAVRGDAAYVVSATPESGRTRVDLTRVDTTGAVAWTRSDDAPAGSTPGPIVFTAAAVVVTGVAIEGRELVAASADGGLAAGRRTGAALVGAEGLGPVGLEEGAWQAVSDGPRLAGAPVAPLARDATAATPYLARRYGAGRPAAELLAYADPRHSTPSWSLPDARPLAACGRTLVVAIDGPSTGTAPTPGIGDTGAAGPHLAGVNPATGAVTWRRPLDGQAPTAAACTTGTVLISGAGGSGAVTALRLTDGAPAWESAPTGLAPADAEPATLTARGDGLLVASRLSVSARLDCLR